MPLDQPRDPFEPEPQPSDSVMALLLRQPGVREAVIEIVEQALLAAGQVSPISPEMFQRIIEQPKVAQRIEAIALSALMETGFGQGGHA